MTFLELLHILKLKHLNNSFHSKLVCFRCISMVSLYYTSKCKNLLHRDVNVFHFFLLQVLIKTWEFKCSFHNKVTRSNVPRCLSTFIRLFYTLRKSLFIFNTVLMVNFSSYLRSNPPRNKIC